MYADPVVFQQNPDGSPNLSVRGQALHSRRDPQREALRIAEEIRTTLATGRKMLAIGIGCGYVLQALHDLLPGALGSQVYFYEPLDEARRSVAPSIRGLAGSTSGVLRSSAAVAGLLAESPALFVLPQWRRLLPDLSERLREMVSDPHAATRRFFFRAWSRNFFARIGSLASLAFLINTDRPTYRRVVYCGAGPRLLRDLAALGDVLNATDTLVVAADTALSALLSSNCEPDLVLSVDSGRGTAYHFLALQGLRNLPLDIPVLSWSAGPSVLEKLGASVLFYRSSLPYEQFLGAGPLSAVPEFSNPSGNAAGVAAIVARCARAQELHLAGADFRAAGHQSHVRGTGYDLYANLGHHRLAPRESYRQDEYTHGDSPAADRTRTALRESAAQAGIAVFPAGMPAQAEAGTGPPAVGMLARKRHQALQLPFLQVRAADMAAFLQAQRRRLPLSQLPDRGRVALQFLSDVGLES